MSCRVTADKRKNKKAQRTSRDLLKHSLGQYNKAEPLIMMMLMLTAVTAQRASDTVGVKWTWGNVK